MAMRQTSNYLAFDLGAESGRAVLGAFDGETLALSTLHRFANGPVRVFDVNGNEYSIRAGEFFSLCRCGLSERKPFCDSSHKRAGFDAPSDASSASWE